MTIYYIDPEGGNDANNGLSFANRWRTFKNTNSITVGITDEFRVMSSRPKQNLGDAAWVDNRDYVVYSSPAFAVLTDGNTLMTGTTNVTITGDFNVSLQWDLQANFIRCTTSGKSGKIAHLNLGSVMDLSAYTHLSLALRSDNDTYPNVLDNITLNLCSDTTGDTVVLALPLGATYRSSGLSQLLTNGGAALPTNIQSISLTLTTATPGTNRAIYFLGLIACQGPDHASHISHLSLLSKQSSGEPEWMAIRGFRTGGKVYFGGRASTTGDRGWRGTAETVNTWVRLPTRAKFAATNEAKFDWLKDGVKITAGWNRTDMSTQDDVTWVSGEGRSISGTANSDGFCNVVNVTNSNNTLAEFTGFGLCHYVYQPLNFSTMPVKLDLEGMASCKRGMPVPYGDSQCDFGDVTFCPTGAMDVLPAYSQGDMALIKARKVMGCLYPFFPPTNLSNRRIVIDKLENSEENVRVAPGITKISNVTIKYDASFFLYDGTTIWLDHPTFPTSGGFPVVNFLLNAGYSGDLRLDCVNGNAWDNRVHGAHSAKIVETPVRTAGKRSMRLERQYSATNKHVVERVALIPVRGGETVKISGYVQVALGAATTEKAALSILEGSFPGIAYTKAEGQRLPGYWSRVVLEVTPPVDGLLPVHFEGFGSGTYPFHVTEVGIDTTGAPADPAPTSTLVQSVTFVGVDDLYWDSDPSVTAGDALAQDFNDWWGGYLSTWPSGSITPGGGFMRGITWSNFGSPGTLTNVSLEIITTELTALEKQGCRVVVKDVDDVVLLDFDNAAGSIYNIGGGVKVVQFSMYMAGLEMIAGDTYTVEFYRLI
jgi:hypothetical protein